MKRAHVLAVGSAVAVGGPLATVWALRAPSQPTKAPVSAPVVEAPQVLPDVKPEARCAFEQDAMATYRVSMENRSTVKLEALGAQGLPPTTATQVSSMMLNMKPLSRDADGTVLLSAFRAIQGGASSLPELNTPFLVRIASNCEVIGFARQAGVDLATARTQQSIVHELQWRFAPDAADVAGQNALGAWQSTMVATATESGVMVQRRIRAYSQIWGTQEADVAPEDSLLTATKAPTSPWFDRVTSQELLTTQSMTTRNTTVATRVDANADALTGAKTDPAAYVWENLLPKKITQREPRLVTQKDLREREAVKHLTANQSVDAYIARVKAGKGIAETWPPLATYLEARPDQTEAVVNRLKADMPAEATAGAFIALGRARTPEALNALLEIKRDVSAPTFERTRAMFSLVDRDDVNADLAREFKEDSQALLSPSTRGGATFGSEALLAVSTMSGLRGEPEVHDIAMEAISGLLVNNTERRTLRPVFKAMANVGDPALLASAKPYMNHADPLLRREVAIVFRRMPADVSLPVALEWLRQEPDEEVRRHIYQIVELQLFDAQVKTPNALVESAARELATNPSIMNRKALIRLLGRAENLTPEVREILKNQARKELAAQTGLYNSITKVLSPEDVREVAP